MTDVPKPITKGLPVTFWTVRDTAMGPMTNNYPWFIVSWYSFFWLTCSAEVEEYFYIFSNDNKFCMDIQINAHGHYRTRHIICVY